MLHLGFMFYYVVFFMTQEFLKIELKYFTVLLM